MRYLFPFALVLGCLLSCTQDASVRTSQLVQAEIDQARAQYAPDKRTALFDVHWDGDQKMLHGETNQPEGMAQLIKAMDDLQVQFVDSVDVLKADAAIVNISVCNIRSAPKHSAELATQSLLGTPLKVFKKNGSWYLVQTPDGYFGWLDAGGLWRVSPEEFVAWSQAEKVVVIEPFEFVYQKNGRDVLTDVVAGNILELKEDLGSKLEVLLPDGRRGVIQTSAVSSYQSFLQPHEPLLENILRVAHRFMGVPYLWGGTSPKAVDCSGFTKTVFYLNGLELPRDASQQVQVGQPIRIDTLLTNLERGDFIFFGRHAREEEKEKITHVAIYLGDGKIIHASGRVQIESLRRGDVDFNEYRLHTMVRAQRMLDGVGEHGVIPLYEHPWY